MARCKIVEVDGAAVRVQWSGTMEPEDVAAIQAIVQAVREKMEDGDDN